VDTFHVNFIDFNLHIPDQVICGNQSVDLNATTPGATDYLWENGSHQPILTARDPGLYTISVSVQNCTKNDTILVSNKGFDVFIGKNDTLCYGMQKVIQVNIDSASYKWQDGSTGQNYVSKRDGKFYVEVEKDGCTATDTIEISYQKCNECIRIPNAFTPDNDGRNDLFKPLIQCPVSKYTILIVNRYGQEIFKTDNPSLAWDGTFNNLVQEVGAYYYLLKVKLDNPDAQEEIFKGDISLIR
jgi:gliding motility-associated-like protein